MDILANLIAVSKHGTYPLHGEGYLFQGRPVVIDSASIEAACAEIAQLRDGIHIARGALQCVGTDYANGVADHLAALVDATKPEC